MTINLIFPSQCLLICFFVISCSTAVPSDAGERPSPEHRIIPTEDLVYSGAFRVPIDKDRPDDGGFSYASGFMTFNPYGNEGKGSIIAMGHADANSMVGEMSIPESFAMGAVESLPRATMLQEFIDIRGRLGSIQEGETRQQTYGLAVVPPHAEQSSPRLYWISIYNYSPANPRTPNYTSSLGSSSINFSALQEAGQWNLSGRLPAQYAWYALTVPKLWADTHVDGQYLAVGRDRINAADGQGWGPSLYTTAPWAGGNPPANGTELANTKLLGYTQKNPVSRNYAHGDGSRGATWAYTETKSAFIVANTKGMRTSTEVAEGDYPYEEYKDGDILGLPINEITDYQPRDTDYKSGPWFATLLFFDTDELAQVAAGKRRPDSVKPYATFNLERFFKHTQGKVPSDHLAIGGAAYDPDKKRLFIMELMADNQRPIIHVFQIRNGKKTLPLAPPTAPANVRNSDAVISWSASVSSAGDTGGISYLIFKWFPAFTSKLTGKSWPAMWRPVAGTTQTSWTDPRYRKGDRYAVTAYDALMQPSHILNQDISD